jgi:hypothetical protein
VLVTAGVALLLITKWAEVAQSNTKARGKRSEVQRDERIAVALAKSLGQAPPSSHLDVRGRLLSHLVLNQRTLA